MIGIGVDDTGSSPIAVDAQNVPLALGPQYRENLAAQCWLWKDHTAIPEAAEITRLASELRPQYLAKIGRTYSSEWFLGQGVEVPQGRSRSLLGRLFLG